MQKLLRLGRPTDAVLRCQRRTTPFVCRQCRRIQIAASPASQAKPTTNVFGPASDGLRDSADARFDVLGTPFSLLSVTLSASQPLYTRRGALVALAGNPEHAHSTLSILSPLKRAFLGIPFLYQRVTATTPVTALIAPRGAATTVAVLHLDGTTDWIVSRRNGLLAWTGHTLTASPRARHSLALAHWGATLLTGRGLAAVTAPGQAYELHLAAGEEMAAHPAHVLAYSVPRDPPRPFRLSGATPRLQVPALASALLDWPTLRALRKTETYRYAAAALRAFRTALRRYVWGDRLFLRFRGPATLVLSSRAARLSDVLTSADVDEIATAPAGAVREAVDKHGATEASAPLKPAVPTDAFGPDAAPSAIHVVTVAKDGKVTFEDAKDLKQFFR